MAKEKRREIVQVNDVLHEVTKLDNIKDKTSDEYKRQHKIAVSKVSEYNTEYGQGGISLSKARSLQQTIRFEKKLRAERKKAQKEAALGKESEETGRTDNLLK